MNSVVVFNHQQERPHCQSRAEEDHDSIKEPCGAELGSTSTKQGYRDNGRELKDGHACQHSDGCDSNRCVSRIGVHVEIVFARQQVCHPCTFNHLNGWKTNDEEYLVNVEKCQSVVSSSWFRPPYGKIRKSQIKKLKDQYKIAMWDVLSGDFDESINGETCAQNVVQNVRSGSIIVFHDSIKAWPRLKRALPERLKQLTEQGYSFKLLD